MPNDNVTQQLEMFADHSGNDLDSNRASVKENAVFLAKIHNYKKNIFLFIILLFVSLISFSLGIERGRLIVNSEAVRNTTADEGAALLPSNETVAIPIQQNSSKQQPIVKEEKKSVSAVAQKRETKKKEEIKKVSYTIQVASVLQKRNADTELSKLKKRGYSAFSFSKGKYTVICVGKFSAKEEAQKLLQKLKSNYPDSQIRRL